MLTGSKDYRARDVGFTPWVKNVKGMILKDQNGS